MAPGRVSRGLIKLAGLYGVQISHVDGFDKRVSATADSLLDILTALGSQVTSANDAEDAVLQRERAMWLRPVEPVHVAWDGVVSLLLRLDTALSTSSMLKVTVELEDGERLRFDLQPHRLKEISGKIIDGRSITEYRWDLPVTLPNGYHTATIEGPFGEEKTTLIAAPMRAADLVGAAANHRHGVFLPTYAIRTAQSWGMGDFSDLRALIETAGDWQAGSVATLPLLPTFEDDPSPYSSVSRLFWNELYVDPRAAPEFKSCEAALSLVGSADFTREIAELNDLQFVDYHRQLGLRRKVLQEIADFAYTMPSIRKQVDRFAGENPEAVKYAGFRAASEKLGRPWQDWPDAMTSERSFSGRDYDEATFRYYLNTQRLAADQVTALRAGGDSDRPSLYLDMPLGVRGDSFDTWRWPGLFAPGISAGAPPDAFFTPGQNWGFPPTVPDQMRESGYRYLRDSVAHVMRHSDILRIDHVMGLHRLFWIPKDRPASEGLYVRYPSEEIYAVLTLESSRNGTVIVGEDLGTVPAYVGPAMRRHNFFRMYAAYFNVDEANDGSLNPPTKDMVAVVNTHDLPTFAAFVNGSDIGDRVDLGLLESADAADEVELRKQTIRTLAKALHKEGLLTSQDKYDAGELLDALLTFLYKSSAAFTVVNLEDMWLEATPQNTPGTSTERQNWRSRMQFDIDAITRALSTVQAGEFPLKLALDRLRDARSN